LSKTLDDATKTKATVARQSAATEENRSGIPCAKVARQTETLNQQNYSNCGDTTVVFVRFPIINITDKYKKNMEIESNFRCTDDHTKIWNGNIPVVQEHLRPHSALKLAEKMPQNPDVIE
jgi:hypothetical protein